jgi:nicotinamidase-related amidase
MGHGKGKKHPFPAANDSGSIPRAFLRAVWTFWSFSGGREMISRSLSRALPCVAIDLNTQRDFCESDRAFPVANHEQLIPSLRRVVAWIKRNQTPVISSIEAHREYELSDSGNPIHCVDGSDGQEKLEFTIFDNRKYVPSDNTLALPVDLFASYQQVIFWKRADDLLTNPKADRLISHVPVGEFLLFGVGVESSIKALTLALLARSKRVSVVIDACGFWSEATADQALRQLEAKGALLVTVEQLLSRKLDRRLRYGRIPGNVRLSGFRAEYQSAKATLDGASTLSRLPLTTRAARMTRREKGEE